MGARLAFLLTTGATAIAALWAQPAAAEWREASSEHFLIYADSEERWIRDFADRLERLDAAIRQLRAMEQPPGAKSNRLVIYTVPNTAAVARLCGKGCGDVAGFYVPRAGGSVAYTPRRDTDENDPNALRADTVLFHEYAHHLMYEYYAAAYPRWFSEGFAEFNASAKIDRDGAVQLGLAAQHRAYALILAHPLPIETVLDDSKKTLDSGEQDVFYGRAWLLTHFLTFSTERKGQLSAYLKLINQGKPSLAAAREAFGDLKALNRDITNYLQKNRLPGLRLAPDHIKVAPITLRTLTAGEAATMPVRMRSDRGVTSEAAREIVVEARKRAAPFPNDAAAQGVLAEAEYDAGNDAECEAAADRAIAADPKDIDALMYKGLARMRIAATAKATDPAVWKEARGWFVKANRVDTDAAEPLRLFYTSFMIAGQAPTKSAADGLLRAFELSPQDGGLRMLAVRQLLIENEPRQARIALLPLAYDPHAGADNFAAKLLAMIDAGTKPADILATMERSGKAEATEGD